MRLPGRISGAIEVLDAVLERHRPVSLALKEWGNANRFAGSGDRAAIGNLVYDALRQKASHGAIMGTETGRAMVLSVVVRSWGENPQGLNEQFATDRFGPEALSDDEINKLTSANLLANAADHIRADVPEWLVSSLSKSLGAEWVDEARALNERPPLDLRVNGLKGERERVLKALKRFDPQPTAISSKGVRMQAGERDARTPNVQTDETYLKGWCEVQDQGSQIVAALAGAKPGEQVLDLCAGAGGKTLALAADMDNRGQIFAFDSDRGRLAPIYDRLKRNGVRNVQVRAPQDGALNDLVGKMDRVVVDAPCTGTGTWRRRPDTKWRLSDEQLQLRVAEQKAVLDEAAGYVRPGGQLVYITCSLLAEENGDQVIRFVESHPEFKTTDMAARWAEVFGAPLAGIISHEGLTLTPRLTETDGFFISVLERS